MSYKENILVVDDDEEMLKIISNWLTFRGWKVTTACNGIEAFDLIEKKNFNLVLTDYNMPQMDGLTLAEKIKYMDPFIRVILVTGACRDTLEQDINIICVDNILYKPFSLKGLDSVIAESVAGNSMLDLTEPWENNNLIRL